MNDLIIAIDPDCRKSGVCKMHGDKIIDATNLTLIELFRYFSTQHKSTKILIENVESDAATYIRKGQNSKQMSKIAQNVGAVKQRYRDICAFADHFGFKVYPITPLAKRSKHIALAKKDAEYFKKITGYQGRTNEDLRDAIMLAMFGREYIK